MPIRLIRKSARRADRRRRRFANAWKRTRAKVRRPDQQAVNAATAGTTAACPRAGTCAAAVRSGSPRREAD